MSTYIALCNWTQQGIQNVKDSPSRLAQAKAAVEAAGGKLTASTDYATCVEMAKVEISRSL